MKNSIPYLAVVIIVCYAFYNATVQPHRGKQNSTEKAASTYREHIAEHKFSHIEEELERLHTDEYTKTYIVNVINHGSSQLHFKKDEVMEEGFVSKEDAPKVACYVLTLSGKECKESYPEDAAMFFTSVCGGCHGNDGKGLGGTYPDLTRKTLLGIEKRESFLKSMLSK
jgi:cytochrome c553